MLINMETNKLTGRNKQNLDLIHLALTFISENGWAYSIWIFYSSILWSMVLFCALLSLERLRLWTHLGALCLPLLLLLLVLLLLHFSVLLLLVHLLFLRFSVLLLLLLWWSCLRHLLWWRRRLTGSSGTFAHLLIIGLVLGKNFLSHFFLLFMDIWIKFVPVLSNWELLVIVNWDEYLLSATRFFFRVVELCNVWML